MAGEYIIGPFYRWGNQASEMRLSCSRWQKSQYLKLEFYSPGNFIALSSKLCFWFCMSSIQINKILRIMNIKWPVYRQLEKAMAPHSSTLAWKIPWTEEPGRLQSMGPLRVRHDWATSLSLFTFMHWRRKWQLTPVFLPGESQGRGSLVGFCLWGRTDMTEAT